MVDYLLKQQKNKYDIVVVDVYRDLTISYHMATVEFFREIKNILHPTGVLCVDMAARAATQLVDIIGNTLLQAHPNGLHGEGSYPI